MPDPRVVVIDEQPEGWFLIGYSATGEFAGDTWHRDLDEARQHALIDHGPWLGEWRTFPDGLADPINWALSEGSSS